MDTDAIAILIKAGGSIAGGVLALVFQPPKTRPEFVTRSIFSVVCGLLFSDAVKDYLHWPDTWQMFVASAALTSLLSWFIMGAATRIIARWTPPKGD